MLQISLRGMEGLEVELEGCLGEGQLFVLLVESGESGWQEKRLLEQVEGERPILILLKTL